MILINCTACQTKLSIDDAFAGGVCRCQHCGTIQTVPGRARSGAGGTRVGARPQKALYQQRARSEQVPGTGLDELADAVATSSGLSNRLTPAGTLPPVRTEQPEPTASKLPQTRVLIGIGAAVIVLLLVVIVLMMSRDTPPADVADRSAEAPVSLSTIDDGAGLPEAPQGPSFCGIKLAEPSVVYLLDRGSATQSSFGYLKEAAYRSIESLGADRKFQIIFWDNGTEAAYPNLLTFATTDNLNSIKRAAEDLPAFGQTDLKPALEKAIAQQPAAVVIATGKGWELDDAFVEMVGQVRGEVPVKIHAINIGGSPSPGLQKIAQQFGGEYRDVSEDELQAFSR
jgi:hypothetical protein